MPAKTRADTISTITNAYCSIRQVFTPPGLMFVAHMLWRQHTRSDFVRLTCTTFCQQFSVSRNFLLSSLNLFVEMRNLAEVFFTAKLGQNIGYCDWPFVRIATDMQTDILLWSCLLCLESRGKNYLNKSINRRPSSRPTHGYLYNSCYSVLCRAPWPSATFWSTGDGQLMSRQPGKDFDTLNFGVLLAELSTTK